MEAKLMTSEELRKRASDLKIKNYKKYKKAELIELIEVEEAKIEAARIEAIKIEEAKKKIEVTEVKAPKIKRERKKGPYLTEVPRGEDSREIYDMILEHLGQKKWTLYKVHKMTGHSYANVRRVYLKYVKPREVELLEKKNLSK